eukprot:gene15310-24598_t
MVVEAGRSPRIVMPVSERCSKPDNVLNAGDCEKCGDGKYLNNNECQDKEKCGAGTKYVEDNTKSKSCDGCEDGTYQSAGNHNNPSCTQQSPTACNRGEKWNSGGTTKANECLPCGYGQYQDANGHKESTCKPQSDCSKGEKYVPNREKMSSCTSCPNGQYQESRAKSESCKDAKVVTCGPGKTWQDNLLTAAPTCPDCVPGTFQPAAGHNIGECTNQPLTTCNRGNFFTSGRLTAKNTCSPCGAGQYQNVDGHTESSCKNKATCRAGEYTTNTDPTVEDADCKPCDAGTFLAKDGEHRDTECTPTATCDPGYYLDGAWSSTSGTCVACKDDGTEYVSDVDHRHPVCFQQTRCNHGTFLDVGEGNSIPSTTKQEMCTTCPLNTYRNESAHQFTKCTPQIMCHQGEYFNRDNLLDRTRHGECGKCAEGQYQDKRDHQEMQCKPYTPCSSGTQLVGASDKSAGSCVKCDECCSLPALKNAGFADQTCSASDADKRACIASCDAGYENVKAPQINHVAYTCKESKMFPFGPDGAVDESDEKVHEMDCQKVQCPALTFNSSVGFSKYAEHNCTGRAAESRFGDECTAQCKDGFYRDPNTIPSKNNVDIGSDGTQVPFQCQADRAWVGEIVCIAVPTLESKDQRLGGGAVPILDTSSFEQGLSNIKVLSGSGKYSWVLRGAPDWAAWLSGDAQNEDGANCNSVPGVVGQWRCVAGESVKLTGLLKNSKETQYQLYITVVDNEFGTSDSIALNVEVLRDLKTTARNSKGEVDIKMARPSDNTFTFRTTVRSYFEVKFFAATDQGLVGEEENAKNSKAVQRVCAIRKKLSESQLKIFEFPAGNGCVATPEEISPASEPLIMDSGCGDPATLEHLSTVLGVNMFTTDQYNKCIASADKGKMATTTTITTTALVRVFDTVPVPTGSDASVLPVGLAFDGRTCTLAGWLEYDAETAHSEGGFVMGKAVNYTVGLNRTGDKYVDGFNGVPLDPFIVVQDVYYNYNQYDEVRLRTNASVELEIFPHISIRLSGETYAENKSRWAIYNSSMAPAKASNGLNLDAEGGNATAMVGYASNETTYTLKADTQFKNETLPEWINKTDGETLYSRFWEEDFNVMISNKGKDTVNALPKTEITDFPLFSANVEIRGGQPPYNIEAMLPKGLKFERTYKIEGKPEVPEFRKPISSFADYTDSLFAGLKAEAASTLVISDTDELKTGIWKRAANVTESNNPGGIADEGAAYGTNEVVSDYVFDLQANKYTERITFIVGLDDCLSDQFGYGSCNAGDSRDTKSGGECVDDVWFDGKYECECYTYRESNCARNPKPSAAGAVMGVVIAVIFLGFGSWTLYKHIQSLKPHDFAADLQRLMEAGFMVKYVGNESDGIVDPNAKSPTMPQELGRDRIQKLRKLGAGAFGDVFLGLYNPPQKNLPEIKVAIKTLKAGAVKEERDDLMKEAIVSVQFEHTNIVTAVGVVTSGSPAMLVLELCARGELQGILKDAANPNNPMEPLSKSHKRKYCHDIVKGMEYLAGLGFVH